MEIRHHEQQVEEGHDSDLELYSSGLNLKQVFKLDRKPNILLVDTSHFHTQNLQDNALYNQLIQEIHHWNKEVEESDKTGKKIVQAGYKNNLYKQLGDQLQEVSKTPIIHTQLKFLDGVNQWYHNQKMLLRDKNSIQQHKSSKSDQFSMGHAKNYMPAWMDSSVQQDPNNIDFEGRTRYDLIDPAEDRLKQFQRKNPFNSSFTTRPTTSEFFRSQQMMSRPDTRGSDLRFTGSEFRPGTQMSNTRGLFSSQSQRPQFGGMMGMNNNGHGMSLEGFANNLDGFHQGPSVPHTTTHQKSAQNIQLNNPNQITTGWNYGKNFEFNNFSYKHNKPENTQESLKDQVSINMIPNKRVYQNDRQTENAYDYDPQWSQKTELRSTFINYQPGNEKDELTMEEKWFKNRNKALQEKRENQEIVQLVSEWAENRGIVEQEINRKNDMQQHGSKFFLIGHEKSKQIKSNTLSQKQFVKKITEIKSNQQNQQDDIQFLENYKPPRTANGRIQFEHDLHDEPQEEYDEQTNIELEKFSEIKNTQNLPATSQIKRSDSEDADRFKQFHDYELTMKKQKLANLKQRKGAIIQWSKENEEKLKTVDPQALQNGSISCYSGIKAKKNKQYRPFTCVYKKINNEQIIKNQLQEVKKLKTAFSQTGLRCSVQALSQALVTPKGFDQMKLLGTKLPFSNDRLLDDPNFNQVKKKTKKGGKK